jgi:PhnB protein
MVVDFPVSGVAGWVVRSVDFGRSVGRMPPRLEYRDQDLSGFPRNVEAGGETLLNLTPFLLFDGNCAEAMAFYHSCLGGELNVIKLGDTPMKDNAAPEQHHQVAYAHLKSRDMAFSATDWMHETRRPRQGNTVAMYITGGTLSDLKEVFDQLSSGADPELLDELQDMPFGIYGHLADRFGVHWFFRGEKAD